MDILGGFFGLWFLIFIAEIALVIYALVDIARRPMDPAMKIIWVVVILVFPIIGSIASLIINRATISTA